jgi:hypothetical protein
MVIVRTGFSRFYAFYAVFAPQCTPKNYPQLCSIPEEPESHISPSGENRMKLSDKTILAAKPTDKE